MAVINGRLSEKSFRGYRRIRPLAASLLRRIDLLAVQDDAYAQRFLALGARPESVHVTGSMKYDGAQTDRANPTTQRLAAVAGFQDEDVVFLAGSTQEPEEAAAVNVFQQLLPEWPKLRLVLVPAIRSGSSRWAVCWTPRASSGSDGPSWTAGVPISPLGSCWSMWLASWAAWWGTARIAFVGGSLGNRGGQNMIEPAAYGAAVSFGPNTRNFRDIVALMLAHQAAAVVADEAELTQFVRRCLEDPAYAAALGERAKSLVKSQQGATARTWGLLSNLIDNPR